MREIRPRALLFRHVGSFLARAGNHPEKGGGVNPGKIIVELPNTIEDLATYALQLLQIGLLLRRLTNDKIQAPVIATAATNNRNPKISFMMLCSLI